MNSKLLKRIALEQRLYAQVVIIRRKESDYIKEKDNTKNITSKDNMQEQKIGLILIMSG